MADHVKNPPPGFDALPVEEQIDYVQSLWDRIAAHPDLALVPPWHVQDLVRREDANRGSPDAGSTWHEVRERICKRLPRKQ